MYIIFLFLLKNIDCMYSLEPPRRGGSNEYPESMFWAEIWKKYQSFFNWIFFLVFDFCFFIYLNRRVFVMANDTMHKICIVVYRCLYCVYIF